MDDKFVLNGFFFEILFAECKEIEGIEDHYGANSERYPEKVRYWQGQSSIKDRTTGRSYACLFRSSKVEGRIGDDLKEYIFGSELLNGKPFTLEDSTCKEAVVDYLARSMLDEYKGAEKDSIIVEIRIPRISLKRLQDFNLAPKDDE